MQVIRQPRIESESFDATLQSRPSAGAFAEWTSKLRLVEPRLAHRRRIAAIYDKYFADHMVGAKNHDKSNAGCFVNYPIWVGTEKRDRVYKKMLMAGYDVGLSLYPNCHEHPKFLSVPGESIEVKRLVSSVLSLPCHPRVTDAYAESLAKELKGKL